MGGMASGLAHEIDQPLSACGAYLATARRLAEMRPEARPANIEEVLDSAVEQNLRAGEIVRNLRDFTMRGEPNRAYLSLHHLIGMRSISPPRSKARDLAKSVCNSMRKAIPFSRIRSR